MTAGSPGRRISALPEAVARVVAAVGGAPFTSPLPRSVTMRTSS